MAERDGDGHQEHAARGDCAAQVEEQETVAEDGAPGAVEESEIADDEQDADLGGAEEALGELEAGEGVGGEIALAGEKQERDEHGDGRLPVEEAGAGEAAHEGDGAEAIDHVIDVEAVAGALPASDAGEGSVEAVTQPVEREAEDDGEQGEAVGAGPGVAEACAELGGEPEEGELVGGEPARGAAGHPLECAFFEGGGEGAVDTGSGRKRAARPCGFQIRLHFGVLSDIWLVRLGGSGYLRRALQAERRVNSSDSRGTLATKGRTAQPRPVGMARDSETDSICI